MANHTLSVAAGRLALYSNPGRGSATAALSILGVDPTTYYASVGSADGTTVFYTDGSAVLVYKRAGNGLVSHSSFTPGAGIKVSTASADLLTFAVSPDGLEVLFVNGAGNAVKVWRNTSGVSWSEVYSFAADYPYTLQISADGQTAAYIESPTVLGWMHDKVTVLTKSGSVWSSTGVINTALPTQNMDSFCQAMRLSADGMTVAYSPDHTPAVRFYSRSGTTWSASTAVTMPANPWLIQFSPSGMRLLAFSSGVFHELGRGNPAWAITTSSVASPAGTDWNNTVRSVGDLDCFAVEVVGGATPQVATYRRVSGVLTAQETLSPDVAVTGFMLVDMSPDGNTVVALAGDETTFDGTHYGYAYVFDYNGTGWSKSQKVFDPAQAAGGMPAANQPVAGFSGSSLFCAGPANWIIERGVTLTKVTATVQTLPVTAAAFAFTPSAATLSRTINAKKIAPPTAHYSIGGPWQSGQSFTAVDATTASTNALWTAISDDGSTVISLREAYNLPHLAIYDLSSGTPVVQTTFQVYNAANVVVVGTALSSNGNVAVVQTKGPTNGTFGVYTLTRTAGTWSSPNFISIPTILQDTLSLSADGSVFAYTEYSAGLIFASMRFDGSAWVREQIAYVENNFYGSGYGYFGSLTSDGTKFFGALYYPGSTASILSYHRTSAGAWVADTPISHPSTYALGPGIVPSSDGKTIALMYDDTSFVRHTRVYGIGTGSLVQIGSDIPFTGKQAQDFLSVANPACQLSLTDNGQTLGTSDGKVYTYLAGTGWVLVDDFSGANRVMFPRGMSRSGHVRVISDASYDTASHRAFYTRTTRPGFDVGFLIRGPAQAKVFTLTASTVGLRYDRKMPATKGAYTLSGMAAGYVRNRTLSPATGAISLTGNAVALKKTGIAIIAPTTGVFTLSGKSTGLVVKHVAAVPPVTYLLSLHDPVLSAFSGLRPATGAYSITASDTTLVRRRNVVPGSYLVEFNAAFLRVPHRGAQVPAATYPLVPHSANLLHNGALLAMPVTKGVFALAGKPAGMRRTKFSLPVVSKAFHLTPNPIVLRLSGLILHAVAGAYAFSGKPASIRRARVVRPTTGSFTFSGKAASRKYNRVWPLVAGHYTLSGLPLYMQVGLIPAPTIAYRVHVANRTDSVSVLTRQERVESNAR